MMLRLRSAQAAQALKLVLLLDAIFPTSFLEDCNFNLNEQAGKNIKAYVSQAVVRRIIGTADTRFFPWLTNWKNGDEKNFIIW